MILAIDPGDETSAAVVLHDDGSIGLRIDSCNSDVREFMRMINRNAILAIELTPPYTLTMSSGRPFVPNQVMLTAIEVGRFVQLWEELGGRWQLVSRLDVKKHLLGKSNGDDKAVREAVLSRYGGTNQAAKGTKRQPGPLYGLSGSHYFAALAVGITYLETRKETAA